MNAFNVQAATSAELVSFYNTHSGNPVIKKFADRKTAEKRVTALIEQLNAVTEHINAEVVQAEASTAVAVVEVAATEAAEVEVEVEVEAEEEVSSDEEESEEEEAARLEAEAAADKAEPVQTAARKIAAGSRRSNAAGVSASWADPAVKAARLIRDGVSVTVNGSTTTHRSCREGFRAYRLPDSMHIRFRLKLKESKVAVFEYNGVSYEFAII